MVWLDVDLNGSKLEEFRKTFNNGCFSLGRSSSPGLNLIFYSDPSSSKQTEVMSYAEGQVTIYNGLLRNLPEKVSEAIADKFRSLDLEFLVGYLYYLPKKEK